jgi:hypothetical protein
MQLKPSSFVLLSQNPPLKSLYGKRISIMKRDKIIYWTSTGIVCAVMVFSVVNFTFIDHYPFAEGAFVHLGLPHYFKIELTVATVLGLVALLLPGIPFKIKEFAYSGFAITLLSASFAHYSSGDSIFPFVIDPLVFLVLLIVSYRYFPKIAANKTRRWKE